MTKVAAKTSLGPIVAIAIEQFFPEEQQYIGYNYEDDESPVGYACSAIFEGTLTTLMGK